VQILLNQHDKVYDSDFKKITSVINPERLRVFLAGLSILHSLMVILDISILSRANGALREGAMYELLKDSNIKS
jgi:exopolyphosphatase/pppGpp-phosphohydrolase